MMLVTREPQQERSQRTQLRLLDATLQELAEVGYAGLRTAAVATRAGVSPGTVFVHYGTKVRLVVAAVKHHFATHVRVDAVSFEEGCSLEEGVRSLLDQMWVAMRSDEYLGVLEVYSAARTDDELREILAPIAEAEIARTNEIGGRVLARLQGADGEAAPGSANEGLLGILVFTLQAAARQAAALGHRGPPTLVMRSLERLIVDGITT